MSFLDGFEKVALVAKARYVKRDIGKLDPTNEDEAWTAKIDGAHTIVDFKKGKVPSLYSHRTSKRTGGKISYNEKLPHIKTPSQFTARFRAETYATDPSGKAVHPTVVTSILNSKPQRSLELQKSLGLKTQTALIDVDKKLPFDAKRRLMEEAVKGHPEFTLPAVAYTSEEKRALLKAILAKTHPQTEEGVIGHHRFETDRPFIKAKVFDEHDVYVTGVFKEKDGRNMAGGFTYSWSPNGETKGSIGSGFDFATKKDMLRNPGNYIGKAARVSAMDVSKNKVLVKPVFRNWHVEKNIEKQATIFAKQSIIIDKEHEPDRDKAKEIARGFADKIYTSRGTKSQWRFRQRPPGMFVKGSFRHAKIKPGVSIIYGQIDEKRKKK